MTAAEVAHRFRGCKRAGAGWQARCPLHDDHKASLSIGDGESGVLLYCHVCGKDATEQIIKAAGLGWSDLKHADAEMPKPKPTIVAVYDYHDESGTLVHQVVRFEPKDFRQRRPDGHGGWIWRRAERNLLYHLDRLQDPKITSVIIVEGGKDCDVLWAIGLPATTNVGGSGKWVEDHTEQIVAAGITRVVIIADADEPGWRHACMVAAHCWDAGLHVRLIKALPGVPDKGDTCDYLQAHSKADLLALIKSAPSHQRIADGALSRTEHDGSVSYMLTGEVEPGTRAAVQILGEQIGLDPAAQNKVVEMALGRLVTLTNDAGPEIASPDKSASDQANDAGDAGDAKIGTNPQASILLRLAEDAELFIDAEDRETAYATIAVDGHRETWPVKSSRFRLWLTGRFFVSENRAPGDTAMKAALATLEARAHHDGLHHKVHVRFAYHDGNVYVDLADTDWRAILIDADGYEVVKDPPVRFRREKGMQPLPEPSFEGDLNDLLDHLNIRRADWPLLAGWLVMAACPPGLGAYPVLVLTGEQGSAKSTTMDLLRRLLDPSSATRGRMPENEKDVMIQAHNSWLFTLDNVSTIPPWLSDCLCSISTGAAYRTRALYTNSEESILTAHRPMVLNGIGDIITRPDLLSRAVVLDLPVIPENTRRDEAEFWASFEAARPGLLAGICSAVSVALERRGTIHLQRKPRMADFVIWVEAAAPGLGFADSEFLEAYARNRDESHEIAIEAYPIAGPLIQLYEQRGSWSGTSTELLDLLNDRVSDEIRKSRSWPKDATRLSSLLRRLAPELRSRKIEVSFDRTNKARLWTIMGF